MKRVSRNALATGTSLFGRLILAAVLTLIAITISSTFGASSSQNHAGSVEVKFADGSVSGLAIVPASCPSDPHYAGECSPTVCPNGLNISTYPSCVCPSGTVQSGSVCVPVPPSCPNGLNITQYPTCLCPAGTVQSGSTCVPVTPTCPNGLNIALYPSCQCPVNYHQNGSVCDPDTGGTGGSGCSQLTGRSCTGLANMCGMTNTGTIQCSGVCSATTPSDNLCPTTCWDGSTPGAGGSCPPCPEGYTKVGNSCVPPGGPQFVGFQTTKGFSASGHLEVRPSIVRSGDVTYVFWNVSNVRDCTVRGTNGDGAPGSVTGTWNQLGSGPAGMTTSPITSRTEYTLFCRALIGATPSTITETRTVNVIPQWYEPPGEQ